MQLTTSSLSASRFYPKFLAGGAVLFILIASTGLQASDLPPAFVLDLPFQANQATPTWLGHPETPPTTFATLDLPIQSPDPTASLLVTVFFQEKQGGFLRIAWQGPQAAQLLSENFYEGIGMSNQRSLLVSPETLMGSGSLSFQCGDTTLGIQRIKLEWLENKTGLGSSQIQDVLVRPESGLIQPAQNLNGHLQASAPATWSGQIVNVPIVDLPQRIEEGVEFSVQLDGVPGSGRLALKVSGLPLGKHLAVWLNQQRAGTITPVVPELFDAGYLTENPPDIYVGWRDGSFYVPVTFHKAGVNTVQFSSEDEVPSDQAVAGESVVASTPPLAVKNVVFQLNYPSPPVQNSSAIAPSQPSSTAADTTLPTGPVIPTASSSTPPETNTP